MILDQHPDSMFWTDLQLEVDAARSKFPHQHLETSFIALSEEVGELAEAILKDKRGVEPHSIYREALQVACMAMRIATENSQR